MYPQTIPSIADKHISKIKIKNLTKRYGEAEVLSNINMMLESGKIYGLVGRNGSGKTMLMRLMCGLILPTEGKVLIEGKELGKDMDFPDSLGLLIENPAFLDSRSGFANLKLLAEIRNTVTDDDIRECIRRVGLDPDDRKKYKKYSLGMKHRLGIAGAVLEKPDILLLDEPTNALDTKGVEMLKQVVKEEKQRGALVVVTCHDTDVLEEIADKIYFMENGRLMND